MRKDLASYKELAEGIVEELMFVSKNTAEKLRIELSKTSSIDIVMNLINKNLKLLKKHNIVEAKLNEKNYYNILKTLTVTKLGRDLKLNSNLSEIKTFMEETILEDYKEDKTISQAGLSKDDSQLIDEVMNEIEFKALKMFGFHILKEILSDEKILFKSRLKVHEINDALLENISYKNRDIFISILIHNSIFIKVLNNLKGDTGIEGFDKQSVVYYLDNLIMGERFININKNIKECIDKNSENAKSEEELLSMSINSITELNEVSSARWLKGMKVKINIREIGSYKNDDAYHFTKDAEEAIAKTIPENLKNISQELDKENKNNIVEIRAGGEYIGKYVIEENKDKDCK